MSRFVVPLLSVGAMVCSGLGSAWAQSAPANFSQSTYQSGMSQITGMSWAKDGADDLLFVSEKTGQIRVIKNGALQGANVASVSVTTNNEAGLDNVLVDPGYSSNKFIYVFACQDIGGGQFRHRIYRFTIANGGTVGTSAGPTQIGPEAPCMNVNHNGSGMAIGTDGCLYWGSGNCGNNNNVGGDGTSTEWTSLGSKIIRVNLANPGTPPSDNPWFNDPVHTDPMIKWAFAKGVRNPFGLRCRPGTSDLWLTAVGDSWEQIFQVTKGSTEGWPTENNTTDASKLMPKLVYTTNSDPNATPPGPPPYYGGCLTRGAFYTGSMFPGQYTGNFFFVDYNSGKVMNSVLNGNTIASSSIFVTGNSNLVDVNVGPDGALYYASNSSGGVYRLTYTGSGPSIVVSTTSLSINEGSSGTFQVHLSGAPASTVTVSVVRTTTDTDVSVAAGSATLTFTPANFGTNQTVTINGASNPDMIDHFGTIQLSAAGMTSQSVSVTVVNTNTVNGAPTASITAPTNGAVVSGTNADFFGQGNDPQGNATLAKAEFYVDGVLKYTDPYVPAVGHFHYGGAHLQWNTTQYSDGSHTLRMTVYDTGGLSGSSQVTVTVNNASGAEGFRGDYYSGTDFNTWVFSRVDPLINFNWGTGAPDTSLPADGFSVRWTGKVIPAFGETYTFYTLTDDGARLWVNGTLIIDHWVNQGPTEWNGTVALTAGTPADILLEYYENTGGAVAQLSWSSASQTKELVPTSAAGTSFASGPPAAGGVVGTGGGGSGGGTGGGTGGGSASPPSNAAPKVWGCGTTGMEAVLVGLLALVRRRRRR